jgi:hypothetical protein
LKVRVFLIEIEMVLETGGENFDYCSVKLWNIFFSCVTKKQETVKRNIQKLQENIKNFLTISTKKMRTLSILFDGFGEFESLFLLQQALCNDGKLGTFRSVLRLW